MPQRAYRTIGEYLLWITYCFFDRPPPASPRAQPGIPFYLGAYLAVDMCIGSVINLVWAWLDPVGQEQLSMAAAAGLLVGDGVWTVPLSLLTMFNVRAPMCMAFSGN